MLHYDVLLSTTKENRKTVCGDVRVWKCYFKLLMEIHDLCGCEIQSLLSPRKSVIGCVWADFVVREEQSFISVAVRSLFDLIIRRSRVIVYFWSSNKINGGSLLGLQMASSFRDVMNFPVGGSCEIKVRRSGVFYEVEWKVILRRRIFCIPDWWVIFEAFENAGSFRKLRQGVKGLENVCGC